MNNAQLASRVEQIIDGYHKRIVAQVQIINRLLVGHHRSMSVGSDVKVRFKLGEGVEDTTVFWGPGAIPYLELDPDVEPTIDGDVITLTLRAMS